MKRPLVVLAVGRSFGVTLTPEEAGSLLGLSDEAVREQCRQHVIPTMPRQPLRGASWRIPTCRLLLDLGIAFDVVEADKGSLPAPVEDDAGHTSLPGLSSTSSQQRAPSREPTPVAGRASDSAGIAGVA